MNSSLLLLLLLLQLVKLLEGAEKHRLESAPGPASRDASDPNCNEESRAFA